MKSILKAIGALLLLMTLASCGTAGARAVTEKTTNQQGGQPVKVSILCADRYILSEFEVEYTENLSAFDILRHAADENGITIDYAGTGEMVYVTGIDNVYGLDMGPESGWVYRVNGEYAVIGCAAYEASEGDIIEWVYLQNMSEVFS